MPKTISSEVRIQHEQMGYWIKKVYSKTFNDYAKAVEPSGSKQETPEKSG
jgi:hypothetical protein